MGKLEDIMMARDRRDAVVDDYMEFIDQTVKSRKGLSRVVISAAYKAFTTLRPSNLREAVEGLLPEFMDVLDGHWSEYEQNNPGGPGGFVQWITPRSETVAGQLLEVNDRIIEQLAIPGLAAMYAPVRKIAKKHTAEAIPGFAEVAVKHMQDS